MIKALIVEDEHNSANVLLEMIRSLFTDVNVIGIANSKEDAIRMIHKNKPSLLFLDINLGAQSGFEVLKETNTDDFEIIVITAHSEHAIEAIKNSAIDYILKPYDFEELREAVNKAKEQLELKNETTVQLDKNVDKISIANTEGIQFIDIKDIVYIKADSCYSEFHLVGSEKMLATKLLAYYERVLANHSFMRIHKSYVANLQFVKGFDKGRKGGLYLKTGEKLPISESKKQEILKQLIG